MQQMPLAQMGQMGQMGSMQMMGAGPMLPMHMGGGLSMVGGMQMDGMQGLPGMPGGMLGMPGMLGMNPVHVQNSTRSIHAPQMGVSNNNAVQGPAVVDLSGL
jgi:hypothetical protein